MADIDDRVFGERRRRVGRQEGHPGGAKGVDDGAQFVRRGAGDGGKIAQVARPADRRALGVDIRQLTEDRLDEARAPLVGRDGCHHRIGMSGEKFSEAVSLLDHRAVQHDAFAGLGAGGRLVPHQHQAVLQQRQFVLAAAHGGDEALGERLVDKSIEHLRWPAHGAHERLVVHARHQILRSVDRLGEPVEVRAFP